MINLGQEKQKKIQLSIFWFCYQASQERVLNIIDVSLDVTFFTNYLNKENLREKKNHTLRIKKIRQKHVFENDKWIKNEQ